MEKDEQTDRIDLEDEGEAPLFNNNTFAPPQ